MEEDLILYKSCTAGNVDFAEYLLLKGANPNYRNPKGNSCLSAAAERSSLAMVKLLIQHGASVNEEGGRTSPLCVAVAAGNLDMVNILLGASADITHRNAYGLTPLHVASAQGYADIVSALLTHQPSMCSSNGHETAHCGCGSVQDATDAPANSVFNEACKVFQESSSLISPSSKTGDLMVLGHNTSNKPGDTSPLHDSDVGDNDEWLTATQMSTEMINSIIDSVERLEMDKTCAKAKSNKYSSFESILQDVSASVAQQAIADAMNDLKHTNHLIINNEITSEHQSLKLSECSEDVSQSINASQVDAIDAMAESLIAKLINDVVTQLCEKEDSGGDIPDNTCVLLNTTPPPHSIHTATSETATEDIETVSKLIVQSVIQNAICEMENDVMNQNTGECEAPSMTPIISVAVGYDETDDEGRHSPDETKALGIDEKDLESLASQLVSCALGNVLGECITASSSENVIITKHNQSDISNQEAEEWFVEQLVRNTLEKAIYEIELEELAETREISVDRDIDMKENLCDIINENDDQPTCSSQITVSKNTNQPDINAMVNGSSVLDIHTNAVPHPPIEPVDTFVHYPPQNLNDRLLPNVPGQKRKQFNHEWKSGVPASPNKRLKTCGNSSSSMTNSTVTLINAQTKDGKTPLYVACENRKPQAVEALLEQGADTKLSESHFGLTPLHIACLVGDTLTVQRMLNRGAKDINGQSSDGSTPLFLAACVGHVDIIRLLLDWGGDVDRPRDGGWSPLHAASEKGYSNIVQVLLERGAYVDCTNNEGATPLYQAACRGWAVAIKVLLNYGADMTLKTKGGWAAIHIASKNSHKQSVNLLLAHGADINTQSKNGETALFRACQLENFAMIEFLLDRGANTSIKTQDNLSPLLEATLQGCEHVVHLLLAAGADVNEKWEVTGFTPLHLTCIYGWEDMAKLLLANNTVHSTARDLDGFTALEWSQQYGHTVITHLLLKYQTQGEPFHL